MFDTTIVICFWLCFPLLMSLSFCFYISWIFPLSGRFFLVNLYLMQFITSLRFGFLFQASS